MTRKNVFFLALLAVAFAAPLSAEGEAEAGASHLARAALVVKWAAEDQGGQVELDSEVGRGSTFRVALPAAASAEGR